MNLMENCVVFNDAESIHEVEATANKKQLLQMQLQQQKLTWHRILANYCFANKVDIIGYEKYENKLLIHNEANISEAAGTIGSSILTIDDLHLLKIESKQQENSNHNYNHSSSIQNKTFNKFSYPGDESLKDEAYKEIKKEINLESRLRKPAKLNFATLIIATLIIFASSNQNAGSCYEITHLKRSDDSGFVNNNHPIRSTMIPKHMIWNQNRMRSINANLETSNPISPDTSMMSDSSNNPTSGVLNGWPSSILSTAFNKKDSLDTHIENILVPRVSGTNGNIQVRKYIVDALEANNYKVDLDEFTDSTPIGNVKFANIIADSNPNACRQLVLACHYDSKMIDGFLGATDSAVPCAMLLKMSETFSNSFRATSDDTEEEDSLGLRFIFFDGEEAYDKWGPTDSLYGSRHLAAKWEKTPAPKHCKVKNELKRIELFVLLDLIGASDTSFVMYNRQLSHHYRAMQKYERTALTTVGLSNIRGANVFKNQYQPLDFVEDDHVPFKQRGVPILSLLSYPFPRVWHELSDNYSAIDFPRTRRILHVLEEFVEKYKK